jgi:hypothetical protein
MLNVQLKVKEIFFFYLNKKYFIYLDETSSNQGRRIVSDTQAGAVPEKYVVVTSNELARVKYILIYSEPNELIQ